MRRKRKEKSTPSPLTVILRLVREMHKKKLDANKKWQKGAEKQGKISCHSCTTPYCCNQLVAAHVFEGAMIANTLIQRCDRDMMKAIIDQGWAQRKMIEEANWTPGDVEHWDRITAEWFDRGEPCALLKDGKCSVYGIRPTTCATYCVYTPAEMCGGGSGTTVLAANASDPIAKVILIESQFLCTLIDFGDDTPISPPVPLGVAVYLGMLLLTEGPEALAGYIRSGETYEPVEGGGAPPG